MIIGIVSDTHMPSRGKQLPFKLAEGLKGVDMILHAGDWTSPQVAEMLGEIAPVDGVAGNNDGADIIRLFGQRKLLELAGRRIAIVHGDGFSRSTEDKAFQTFRNERPDVIIFGHSHIPCMEMREGILMFNPGSPTDKRFQPRYSFGLMELGERIQARHVYYDSKA